MYLLLQPVVIRLGAREAQHRIAIVDGAIHERGRVVFLKQQNWLVEQAPFDFIITVGVGPKVGSVPNQHCDEIKARLLPTRTHIPDLVRPTTDIDIARVEQSMSPGGYCSVPRPILCRFAVIIGVRAIVFVIVIRWVNTSYVKE